MSKYVENGVEWETHYTGCEFARMQRWFGEVDYTRWTSTKKMTMIRASVGNYTLGWMDGVAFGNVNEQGSRVWFHGSNKAWFPSPFFNSVGWLAKPYAFRGNFRWQGSISEPDTTWTWRVGRVVLSGRTPTWFRRLRGWVLYRMAVREAKRGLLWDLCQVCRNGIIEDIPGFAGETIYMCKNCGNVVNCHFDRTAIE